MKSTLNRTRRRAESNIFEPCRSMRIGLILTSMCLATVAGCSAGKLNSVTETPALSISTAGAFHRSLDLVCLHSQLEAFYEGPLVPSGKALIMNSPEETNIWGVGRAIDAAEKGDHATEILFELEVFADAAVGRLPVELSSTKTVFVAARRFKGSVDEVRPELDNQSIRTLISSIGKVEVK